MSRVYTLDVEIFRGSIATAFDVQKITSEEIKGAISAQTKARGIAAALAELGLSCSIIRRNRRGEGRLLGMDGGFAL